MSHENVELVRRSWTAYEESGVDRVTSFMAEDHVAYSAPEWPDDSEYHGHDGFRKPEGQRTESFDDFGFEIREVRDAGDVVVVLLDMTGRIKGSGVPIHQPVGAVHGDFTESLGPPTVAPRRPSAPRHGPRTRERVESSRPRSRRRRRDPRTSQLCSFDRRWSA